MAESGAGELGSGSFGRVGRGAGDGMEREGLTGRSTGAARPRPGGRPASVPASIRGSDPGSGFTSDLGPGTEPAGGAGVFGDGPSWIPGVSEESPAGSSAM
ncbi:hypothetical protein ACIGXM_25920 [Kitasatospora sp. NPDC052896]|uniref:hypothetical protein n=1 Tax=Kitasatospora sp. NPDC052896 TaxID=3364061 RepID=UPI0037C6731D